MATSEGEGQATSAPVPAATATATRAPPMPMPESSESVLQRVADVMRSAAPTPAPTQIGNYRLHEIIGEGGMGVVFRAEQLTPIRRTVALKLIKPGMFGREVLARFHDERQALALMNHPNVARVYDAGTSEHGRPYFVMELVPGQPITSFCDQHRLTVKQRLELFVQACHAVQHAHQKAIIHRDLKPSNILVMLQDGKPVVKVIDFGVAKATAQRLTERTMFTETGQLIGTPEYMSPEQAEMNALDIDTRTDIYTLGVVLYELLTGSTPLEHKRALRLDYRVDDARADGRDFYDGDDDLTDWTGGQNRELGVRHAQHRPRARTPHRGGSPVRLSEPFAPRHPCATASGATF